MPTTAALTPRVRRRSREKLREGDGLRIGRFVHPPPSCHELLTKISEMRDRSTERDQTKPEEDEEDLERALHALSYRRDVQSSARPSGGACPLRSARSLPSCREKASGHAWRAPR